MNLRAKAILVPGSSVQCLFVVAVCLHALTVPAQEALEDRFEALRTTLARSSHVTDVHPEDGGEMFSTQLEQGADSTEFVLLYRWQQYVGISGHADASPPELHPRFSQIIRYTFHAEDLAPQSIAVREMERVHVQNPFWIVLADIRPAVEFVPYTNIFESANETGEVEITKSEGKASVLAIGYFDEHETAEQVASTLREALASLEAPAGTVETQQLFQMEQDDVDAFLRSLQGRESFEERLAEVVRRSLDTPYADGPLGEGPTGKYDTDPLIDLSRADCVTYVEQTIAGAVSADYENLVRNLQRIRYKDGTIDYETRNHFMISDWIRNNTFCRDVTSELGVPTEQLSRLISRRDFFRRVGAPELGAGTPSESIRLTYVPSRAITEAERRLPDTALVVFIGNVDWLFSLHCGLYLRDSDGRGALYHASSKEGKVVGMDLADYVRGQNDRYIGVTAYAVTEPDFPR